MADTIADYNEVIAASKDLFMAKTRDYGASWLCLRLGSFADQLFIKVSRIRQLERLEGRGMVAEGVDAEYQGVLNYCVMALMVLWFGDELPRTSPPPDRIEVDPERLSELYDRVVARTKDLLLRKNHDYGEAWREMRLPSITDQLLVRVYRLRAITEGDHSLLVSEQADAHLSDMVNYSAFALILLKKPPGAGSR